MTTMRYDVWFDDDGLWRIDSRNLTEAGAREAMAALKDAGYAHKALAHDPDYSIDRSDIYRMPSVL